ncbi:MAG: hypothetical protein HY699_08280 [Deltaproteobacteria bacterium]|nr:hypothetical protein [Deltaproteobacteria bacterium]
MPLIRHSAFVAGLVMLVLGVGNWSVAYIRLAEYDESRVQSAEVESLGSFEEFGELNARTNAKLLRPLQQGTDARAATDAKVDFYQVVRTGGQLFTFAGVGLILFAGAMVWRTTRDLAAPAPR